MTKMTKILVLLSLLFSLSAFAADKKTDKKNSSNASSLNRMIEHERKGAKMAKTGKESSTDKDMIKLFNELMVEHEKEMKRLLTLRDKMFPEVKKFEAEIASDIPKVEINEGEKDYTIKAELPGMARDEVKVSVIDNDLIISGSRKNEIKQTKPGITSTEFSYGAFERIIPLDKKVDPKSLDVEFKDGIINVHLDKDKQAQGLGPKA